MQVHSYRLNTEKITRQSWWHDAMALVRLLAARLVGECETMSRRTKKKKLSGEQTTNDRTRERLCAASRGGTKDSGAKLEPGSVGLRDKERPIDVRVDTVRVPAAVVARNHSTNTCCNSRHYNRLQPKRSHTRSIPRMFLSLAGRAHLEKSSREQTFFLYHPDRRYNPPGVMC